MTKMIVVFRTNFACDISGYENLGNAIAAFFPTKLFK